MKHNISSSRSSMLERHRGSYEQELRSSPTDDKLGSAATFATQSTLRGDDSANSSSAQQDDKVGPQPDDVSPSQARLHHEIQSGPVQLSSRIAQEPAATNGEADESEHVQTDDDKATIAAPDLSSTLVPDDKEFQYKTDSDVEGGLTKVPGDKSIHNQNENGTTIKHMAPSRNPPQYHSEVDLIASAKSESAAVDGALVSNQQSKSEIPQASDQRLWDRVKHLRADIWSMRSRLYEIRQRLRHKQALRSAASDELFQYVRRVQLESPISSTNPSEPINNLERLSAASESTHVECTLIEDELETVENDLGVKEFALQKLEIKLYENDAHLRTIEHGISDIAFSHSSGESASLISHDYHPVVSEYLSKLGDVDISRERLDWHLDEKDNLDEEKARRQRIGLELAESERAWLDEFAAVRLEIQTQLEIELRDAEELRLKAFSMGLIDAEGEPISFEEQERRNFHADFENVDAASGYVEFSTLLPPPSGLQIGLLESTFPENYAQAQESVNPRLRVDQWLLHQLRMSSVNIRLLAQEFKAQANGMAEPQQWQDEVLQRWFNDNAGVWRSAPVSISSKSLSCSTMSIPSPYSHRSIIRLAAGDEPTPVIAPAQHAISAPSEMAESRTTLFHSTISLANPRATAARSV